MNFPVLYGSPVILELNLLPFILIFIDATEGIPGVTLVTGCKSLCEENERCNI